MFTLIHVLISVLGIVAGLVVIGGLMGGARGSMARVWAPPASFFPADKITPAHAVGAISLVVLLVFVVLGWAALRVFRNAR